MQSGKRNGADGCVLCSTDAIHPTAQRPNSDRFKGKFRYSYMYRVIVKRIQRARYEQGLLALARAYVGYDIYFPAFIDFRGRLEAACTRRPIGFTRHLVYYRCLWLDPKAPRSSQGLEETSFMG
jgi:hypothetical protein